MSTTRIWCLAAILAFACSFAKADDSSIGLYSFTDTASFMAAVTSGVIPRRLAIEDNRDNYKERNELWRSIVTVLDASYGVPVLKATYAPSPPTDAVGFSQSQLASCLSTQEYSILRILQNYSSSSSSGRANAEKSANSMTVHFQGECEELGKALDSFFDDYKVASSSYLESTRQNSAAVVSTAQVSAANGNGIPLESTSVENKLPDDGAPSFARDTDQTRPIEIQPKEAVQASKAAENSRQEREPDESWSKALNAIVLTVIGIGFLLAAWGVALGIQTKVIFYGSSKDVFITLGKVVAALALTFSPLLFEKENQELAGALLFVTGPAGIFLIYQHTRSVDGEMSAFDALCVTFAKFSLFLLAFAQLNRGNNPNASYRRNYAERATGLIILSAIAYLTSKLINRNRYFALRLARDLDLKASKSNLSSIVEWLENHLEVEVTQHNYEQVLLMIQRERGINFKNTAAAA